MSFTSNEYEEYTIRLHHKRDLDLFTLYMNDKMFKRKIVKILSDYAKGITPIYPLDGVEFHYENAVRNGELTYKSQVMQLYVNKKLYPEVVELLSQVRKYYRCDLIKCVIKNSLPFPITALYFSDIKVVSLQKNETVNGNVIAEEKTDAVKKVKKKAKKTADIEKILNPETTHISRNDDNKSIDDKDSTVTRTEDMQEENSNNTDIFDMLIENY